MTKMVLNPKYDIKEENHPDFRTTMPKDFMLGNFGYGCCNCFRDNLNWEEVKRIESKGRIMFICNHCYKKLEK